jgi:hypothetical protein
MEKRKGPYRVLVGNMRERDHLEDLGVDGRIISKWILRNFLTEDLLFSQGGLCSKELVV